MQCKTQTALSRIWTRVANSISYDDNHCAKHTLKESMYNCKEISTVFKSLALCVVLWFINMDQKPMCVFSNNIKYSLWNSLWGYKQQMVLFLLHFMLIFPFSVSPHLENSYFIIMMEHPLSYNLFLVLTFWYFSIKYPRLSIGIFGILVSSILDLVLVSLFLCPLKWFLNWRFLSGKTTIFIIKVMILNVEFLGVEALYPWRLTWYNIFY